MSKSSTAVVGMFEELTSAARSSYMGSSDRIRDVQDLIALRKAMVDETVTPGMRSEMQKEANYLSRVSTREPNMFGAHNAATGEHNPVMRKLTGGVRRGPDGRFMSDADAYASWLERGAARTPLDDLRGTSRPGVIMSSDPLQAHLAGKAGYREIGSAPRVASGGGAGGGGVVPPGSVAASPNGGAGVGGTSFWTTSVASTGMQIGGMAALGAGIGGASAWLTGGNTTQGMLMGGLLGAAGGVYNQQIMHSLGAGIEQGALRFGRMPGPVAPGGRVPLSPNAQKAFSAGRSLSKSRSSAAAMAAGAGLAGGVFLSGHRRRPVNGYNSRRGNYIGG